MDLPEQFESITLASIEAFVERGQQEHLLLDFKLVSRTDLTAGEDKRNLAKALSGFANSSGGIIVWGVDARRSAPDGPDVACRLSQISDVQLFESRLNELTGGFVRPFVDGVRHRAIVANDRSGFAVTMVPASDAGPHMALAGENRYYKRSGDSFYTMEHFDVADMFGRRRRPVLSVVGDVFADGAINQNRLVKLVLSIENTGRGSAQSAFLAIRVAPPYKVCSLGVDGNGAFGLRRVPAALTGEHRYVADAGTVLHPLMRHAVTALRIEVPHGTRDMPDVMVSYDIAADGMPLSSKELTVPGAAILAQLDSSWG